MGSCLSICIKKGERFSTCFSKGPNPDDLKVKRRSMRLPADIGVELGLGMTKNTNQYPQSQIIENFFSIDETELHYKNYHMKRIPIIQCRDENGRTIDESVDLSEHCDDESELEPESDSADSVCPANVRDMLARKYSYKQAMCIGAFSETVYDSDIEINSLNKPKRFRGTEYSDDSEEVFEKEDFDDFDRTVSTYLDELETNSPKSKHNWSRPMLEYFWSFNSSPRLDLDEFRSNRRLSVVNEECETGSPSNSIVENPRIHWTLDEACSEEDVHPEWRHGSLASFQIYHSEEDRPLRNIHHQALRRQQPSASDWPHQGWLTPKLATSKTRPLELSSFSSMDEDDRSEDSTDQTVTLKVSASSGSPTPSLPSMTLSVAASSSYATPIPSPLVSPQSSFHSCRSSAYLSSPSDSDPAEPRTSSRSRSLHVKPQKREQRESGTQQLRRVWSNPLCLYPDFFKD